MRLPRNIRMFRGPADASALAGTLFLLWMVTLLHSSMVFPPGIRLQLPDAATVWGEVIPQMAVAVDPMGRLVFEQQLVTEARLIERLRERASGGGVQPTLLLLADRAVPMETVARLASLARSAGIRDIVLATNPRPIAPPVANRPESRKP